MKIAVVGGGINGVMSAWALAAKRHSVDLFERAELMGETSSASTKLLHGGLRYLEQGRIGLVRDSLRERQWWMNNAPHLAQPIRIYIPLYDTSSRKRPVLTLGLKLYDWLSGEARLGRSQWWPRDETLKECSDLKKDGLRGAFVIEEVQMDDNALGLWAAEKARNAGVQMHLNMVVESVSTTGRIYVNGDRGHYDRVINAAGPWARDLLERSSVASRHEMDLVKGSHLLLDHPRTNGFLLAIPSDGRFGFVLPYRGRTLVGTTEVRQTISEPICCSDEEREYLVRFYEHYFAPTEKAQCATFAGLRPLLRSHRNPNKATREFAIEKSDSLITIFGGKWTTSRLLGERLADIAA